MQQAQVPLLLSIEEQNQVAMRVGGQGEILFFNAKTGVELKRVALPLPAGSEIRSIAQDQPGSPTVALGLSNGQVLVFQHTYKVTYPDNKKTITPEIAFPYGETPIGLDPQGRPLEHVSINAGDDSLLLAGSVDKQLLLLSMTREENMLTGESTLDEERIELPQIAEPVKAIYLDPRKQWLYVINGRATADVFDLHSRQLNGRYKLLEDPNAEVTASTQLLGGISLLVGDSKGGIAQWFMARDTDGEPRLSHVRDFNLDGAPISAIAPEQRRKGFIALDEKGNLGVFHSTAHRTLLVQPVADSSGVITLSPRANRLLLEQGGKIHRFALSNPHPEISWSALWGKVWYESYDKPAYVWQSTAATTDFEPKLSLSPLTFGTLKAAFYAMILAAPLAIAAAVYTAYFMAPAMRRKVKPVIELMEALPTVI
ncbi:phosphate ABC transporter permease, partial [Pseudomonas aeruginosa]|nr:phosphate ABC transporter permease [Pseudomonas aeruginosa]